MVDYQKDFVDGALGFAGAELLDGPIASHIDACRGEGWDIIFTLDTHAREYLTTQEGNRLPVKHCIRGTPGHALYGRVALARRPEDVSIEKPALGSRALMEHLAHREYQQIQLCGLVSHMCVLSNAVIAKAALPEARVVVKERLTASFDPELHGKAMDVLRGIQIDVE